MKETFEYRFHGVRINVRCWFDIYAGNGFFTVHFEFILAVNGIVSNNNIQEN